MKHGVHIVKAVVLSLLNIFTYQCECGFCPSLRGEEGQLFFPGPTPFSGLLRGVPKIHAQRAVTLRLLGWLARARVSRWKI